MNQMTIPEKLELAFSKRRLPEGRCALEHLSDYELDEVISFCQYAANEIDSDALETFSDVIYWLSEDAFVFYLPVFISVSINENEPNLLVCHSLINMLDRSLAIENWDDFFAARWLKLTKSECEPLIDWILWLSGLDDSVYSDEALSRAFDVLTKLKEIKLAGQPLIESHSIIDAHPQVNTIDELAGHPVRRDKSARD
ncbi:hypothetical protein ACH42_05495 [Endozoicomonas sp. (ex Bugula neritina AB1)]|nr:hypothetical protein ACH42_05495 [Endozoicomonas sp. (ex Bugula neritina AB1)]